MSTHTELGALGEALAADFLREKEYTLLAKNWRFLKGEIDIIAQKNEQLVIVEVKTRTTDQLVRPQDAVTKKKQKELIKTAHAYIEEHHMEMEAQFDIISIVLKNGKAKIEHLEDAFYPSL